MIKERLKTLLLASLVCMSLFFTRKLWITVPENFVSSFKSDESAKVNYIFPDMLNPTKYVLNFNKKNHTVFYSDEEYKLWASSKEILKQVLSSENFEIVKVSDEEYVSDFNKRSLVFYFPEDINVYILAKVLDINKPNDITENVEEVNSIYLSMEKNSPFIILGKDGNYFKIYNFNIEMKNLRELFNGVEQNKDYTYYYSMRDTLEIDNNIYMPYEMINELPVLYVENEINIEDEEEIKNIVEGFFNKNIDYIREITEDNGSMIYIDNQKFLKIYKDGVLEYFCPLEKTVKKRNLYISLNSAADFISAHVSSPKGIYLSKVNEIKSDGNSGYGFTFKYKLKGYPVLLEKDDMNGFIYMEVFNDYVRTYKSLIRKDMNISVSSSKSDHKMLSAFDVLDLNYSYIEGKYIEDNDLKTKNKIEENLNIKIMNSIDDVYLAYLDPCKAERGEKLTAVWVIKISGRIYAFDVYTGQVVYEKFSKE